MRGDSVAIFLDSSRVRYTIKLFNGFPETIQNGGERAYIQYNPLDVRLLLSASILCSKTDILGEWNFLPSRLSVPLSQHLVLCCPFTAFRRLPYLFHLHRLCS